MTDKLREAAQEFVRDYENGEMGDLKHYARAMRAALADHPPTAPEFRIWNGVLPASDKEAVRVSHPHKPDA
jgi:hypothetical protein